MQLPILKGDVYWVNLDPALGTEIKKKRPAVIISNDIQNSLGKQFIIAPITSNCKKVYPFEVLVNIQGKNGKVLLDQIRTVDIQRLVGSISGLTQKEMNEVEKAIKLVLALH